jgi:hypothetical protein
VIRFSADDVLHLPVRVREIEIGRPVDVILDRDARRVWGFEVRCGDDTHRFLPLGASQMRVSEISVESALTLLDEDGLAFYRKRGSTLRSLRGATVERERRAVGALRDLVVAADGAIAELILADGRRVAVDDRVRISGERRRLDAA